ncbi:hypothetical protein HMPREF0648_2085 [Prevotella bivia JCVIHMP010]|nr:hypothetical protein HMPREF0648_2085 [Prevotella bivia JCVIHMP010]
MFLIVLYAYLCQKRAKAISTILKSDKMADTSCLLSHYI